VEALQYLHADVSHLSLISRDNAPLAAMVQDLLSTPFSGTVITKARSISKTLSKSSIDRLHEMGQHLLIDLVLWRWMERQAIENATLQKLRLKIKEVSKAQEDAVLDAADYLDGLDPGQFTFLLHMPRHANHTPSSLEFDEAMIAVLASWFGLQPKSRERSWFAHSILDSPLGISGLRLRPFVAAANNLSLHLHEVRNRVVNKEHVETWTKEWLLVHPICDRNSEHFAVAMDVAKALDKTYPWDLELLEQVKQALHPIRQPARPPPPPLPPLSMPTSLVPNQDEFQRLVHMLRGLLPILSPDFTCPTEDELKLPRYKLTPDDEERILHKCFLAGVCRDQDKFLPFRNSAPSRKRILEPGGPYDPKHVRTKSGFFSALVYRGITHNTDFLQNNKTLFKDLDDWKDTLKEPHNHAHREQKDYFCRSNAYGVPSRHRKIDNVDGYWKLVSEDANFTGWLTSNTKISAPDLYAKIKQAAFGFGPLTTLQIVMDYVECGMTQPLTPEQMGWFIWEVRLGGLKGLLTLGYKIKSKDQVGTALASLSSALEKVLSETERRDMGFGLILIEHSMCKLGRLTKAFTDWHKTATRLTLNYH
jgi:hypothetical protein